MLIFDIAMFQTNVATTYSTYFIRSGHHATSDDVTVRISLWWCHLIEAPGSDVRALAIPDNKLSVLWFVS
jgi:hypothetical protein